MYKIKSLAILNVCIALFFSSLVMAAETEPQRQSIEALGELNGIALHCQYLEHVRFIKQSLVETLPKKRRLGDIFEDATNTSFLAFAQRRDSCPSPAEFDQQVNAAIDQLYKAFLRR
ncbi:MAG: hypothetical protein OQK73_06380 [Gammaproteobacteria bacterium]|nr:hypothetical protein [Gammaproteobacteria bacterium]